jgi:hypothetical protein
MSDGFSDVISRLWLATGTGDEAEAPVAGLATTGPRVVFPAAFDVTGLATGAVAVATLAAAELLAMRRESPAPVVTVDSKAASAAFAAERLFAPVGWSGPPLWDPIAGNYRAADGWIRLHTNYAYHRAAVEQVLGARDRDTVQAAVAGRPAEELESAVVEAGGAAAVMHERSQWLSSPPGAVTADAPLMMISERPAAAGLRAGGGQQPLQGVRVLDLTRVIAGPVATKFLAGYGADVLRIDPPGFEEVPSLLPETTLGKRTTALDLTAPADRATFEQLVADTAALTRKLTSCTTARIHASLVGTANLLYSLPRPAEQPPKPNPKDFLLEDTDTAWGPARRVPLPGLIDGAPARWPHQAGPLGQHPATWNEP